MLPGDNLHRVLGVPDPRSAVVPQPVLVLSVHLQLLFLRRKSRRLLWLLREQAGRNANDDEVPPLPLLLAVLHRVRLVRALADAKVLHAPILALRLDPRGAAYCGHAELPNHREHIPGHDLVHCARFHDCVQRRDGVYVWLLLRQNAVD